MKNSSPSSFGFALLFLFGLSTCSTPPSESLLSHPNVLFISIDDLNDWVEPLAGHAQTLTPHLNQFAQESVNFSKTIALVRVVTPPAPPY